MLLGGYVYWRMETRRVKVVFCDVGQGDGVLISWREWQMVYDVGPKGRKMVNCLGKYVPFWDKTIETVIISHWDEDHSGGLEEVNESYKIEQIFGSERPEGVKEQFFYSGDLIKNDIIRYGEIDFEILSPDQYLKETRTDDNGLSVVGLLSYKSNKILLMGDVDGEVENRLVWRGSLGKRVEGAIIKVSHHGARESTTEELLDEVKPKMAVIGVGRNSFGHPSKEVLGRLEKAGVEVWRTDERGELVVRY